MAITLDHQQIQYALKEFDIREQDYYLEFDQSVYMVWCTTGTKALELMSENSCVSIDYKNQWYYCRELPKTYVVPSYVCIRYILETN
jgi:hypothetical protein